MVKDIILHRQGRVTDFEVELARIGMGDETQKKLIPSIMDPVSKDTAIGRVKSAIRFLTTDNIVCQDMSSRYGIPASSGTGEEYDFPEQLGLVPLNRNLSLTANPFRSHDQMRLRFEDFHVHVDGVVNFGFVHKSGPLDPNIHTWQWWRQAEAFGVYSNMKDTKDIKMGDSCSTGWMGFSLVFPKNEAVKPFLACQVVQAARVYNIETMIDGIARLDIADKYADTLAKLSALKQQCPGNDQLFDGRIREIQEALAKPDKSELEENGSGIIRYPVIHPFLHHHRLPYAAVLASIVISEHVGVEHVAMYTKGPRDSNIYPQTYEIAGNTARRPFQLMNLTKAMHKPQHWPQIQQEAV